MTLITTNSHVKCIKQNDINTEQVFLYNILRVLLLEVYQLESEHNRNRSLKSSNLPENQSRQTGHKWCSGQCLLYSNNPFHLRLLGIAQSYLCHNVNKSTVIMFSKVRRYQNTHFLSEIQAEHKTMTPNIFCFALTFLLVSSIICAKSVIKPNICCKQLMLFYFAQFIDTEDKLMKYLFTKYIQTYMYRERRIAISHVVDHK